jgi:hypothetical protein
MGRNPPTCTEDNESLYIPRLYELDELENAARQLFQTVKDHSNRSIEDMLDILNVYYSNAHDSSTDEENDEEEYDEEFHQTHFPSVPCCVTIVNHDGYLDAIQSALARL